MSDIVDILRHMAGNFAYAVRRNELALAADEIERLRARVAELEAREEKTRRYADRLAINIKLKHFSDRVPDWQPLPDTLGILTQIDNMTAGIGERVAELDAAQAWRPIETLKPSISEYALLSINMMGKRMPELGYRDPLGVVRSNRMAACNYATHWMPLPEPPKEGT